MNEKEPLREAIAGMVLSYRMADRLLQGPLAELLAERDRLTGERDELRRQAAIGAWVEACVSDGVCVHAPDGWANISATGYHRAALAAGAPVSGDPTPDAAHVVRCIRCEQTVHVDRMTEHCPRGRGVDQYHERIAPTSVRSPGWSLHVEGCPSAAPWLYGT